MRYIWTVSSVPTVVVVQGRPLLLKLGYRFFKKLHKVHCKTQFLISCCNIRKNKQHATKIFRIFDRTDLIVGFRGRCPYDLGFRVGTASRCFFPTFRIRLSAESCLPTSQQPDDVPDKRRWNVGMKKQSDKVSTWKPRWYRNNLLISLVIWI